MGYLDFTASSSDDADPASLGHGAIMLQGTSSKLQVSRFGNRLGKKFGLCICVVTTFSLETYVMFERAPKDIHDVSRATWHLHDIQKGI